MESLPRSGLHNAHEQGCVQVFPWPNTRAGPSAFLSGSDVPEQRRRGGGEPPGARTRGAADGVEGAHSVGLPRRRACEPRAARRAAVAAAAAAGLAAWACPVSTG